MSKVSERVCVAALVLAGAACVENPDGERLDEMRQRLDAEMTRRYQRPALGSPEDGRAFEWYARGLQIAKEHRTPYQTDDWAAIDAWHDRDWRPPLPDAFDELRQARIDLAVAEAMQRGARNLDGASEGRLQMDELMEPYSIAMRDLMAMSVHRAIAEGEPNVAIDRALALLWFGHDCQRGEGLVGSTYGWYYADAANRLLRAVEDDLRPEDKQRAARYLSIALDSEVDHIATMDAEVLFAPSVVLVEIDERGYGSGRELGESETVALVHRQLLLWDRIRTADLSQEARLIAYDLLGEIGHGSMTLRYRKRNLAVRAKLRELRDQWQ